jgi:broad specificity phosphatase PhoE
MQVFTIIGANPKIYLIRHAPVDLKKPGWGTSKLALEYKAAYNLARIEVFNPDDVLQRIEDYERLNIVFCSPQSRALETARILFDDQVTLIIKNELVELDYPIVHVPFFQLPMKVWQFISRITWMTGINRGEISSYKKRQDELCSFSDDLIKTAHRDGLSIVIAHGMVNHELIKILNNRGWKYCKNGKNGFGNLSVNCLVFSD